MTTPPAVPIRLTLAPRGGRKGPLYPGQTADFDVTMENTGPAPLALPSLQGNLDTPVVRLFDEKGTLGAFDNRTMGERMVGDVAALMQPDPSMETLAPGARDATWINLWSFHDPLPPGTYSVDAVHKVDGAVEVAASRLVYDIVPARVHAAALAYDSRNRAQSLLAWLAAPDGAPTLRLLVRESGTAGHASLHQGGTPYGEFPPGTSVALSQYAPDVTVAATSWVAALAPDGVATVFRQASTFPQGAPIRFATGLGEPKPIPRFPDRGHAVLLATGITPKGPALAGFVVAPAGLQSSWTVPLPELPKLAACAFSKSASIHVLLGFDSGTKSTLQLLELDDTGRVLRRARTVLATPHVVLAVTANRRLPLGFHVLEADRAEPDQVGSTYIPANAPKPVEPAKLARLSGWPSLATPAGPRPEPARALNLEQAFDDSLWLALVDRRGNLYGANLASGPLTLVREAGQQALVLPHVAALRAGNTIFAFSPEGLMLTGQR